MLWQAGGPAPKRPSTFAPAIDPTTGNIWVADSYDSVFWIFSPDGKYLEAWGTPGKGQGQFDFSDHAPKPDGFGAIAFAPDGTFFVSDVGNNRVEKFAKDRTFLKSWGGFGSGDGQFAQALEVVTDGKTLYVGDGDRSEIEAFDVNGTFLRVLGGDQGYSAFLALDRAGNLYATNPSASDRPSIGKFDVTGKQVATIDMAFGGGDPVGLGAAADGRIYITVDGLDSAYTPKATYELDPTGNVLRAWSSAGQSLLLAPDGKAFYAAYSGFDNGWGYIRKYAIP